MTRHAQANCGKPGGDFIRDGWIFGNDESKRAWPIFSGEAFGFGKPFGGELAGLFGAGDVDDERARGRASFELVDLVNSDGIKSVSSKAVDRFGGEDHESAIAQDSRGFANGVVGRTGDGGL